MAGTNQEERVAAMKQQTYLLNQMLADAARK